MSNLAQSFHDVLDVRTNLPQKFKNKVKLLQTAHDWGKVRRFELADIKSRHKAGHQRNGGKRHLKKTPRLNI